MPSSGSYVPTSYRQSSASSDGGALDIGQRVRLITQLNPYMSDRPDVLAEMAQQPMSIDQLVSTAGQSYGMMAGDSFAQRLASMSPGTQRAIWGTLGKSKQMAMTQLGYNVPQDESSAGGLFKLADKYLGPVDEIAGAAFGGLGKVVMPVLHPVLDTLNWVGDQPAHLYRSIRLMDDQAQWAALAGAAVGLTAAALFVPTGGLSTLAAGGILAGGGLLGGTAAAAISNPSDWWSAFGESWHGERTFDRPSRAKADELLGDPRLVTLAHDMAGLNDFNINDLATELAGQRSQDQNSQLAAIGSLAERFGGVGTPEYQQAYQAMLNVSNDPLFQQAVTTLQQGKISVGRDLADNMGLAPDSGLHRLVSGLTDAAWVVAVDPTLMLGGAAEWRRAERAGVRMGEGSTIADNFLHVVQTNPAVREYQDVFLKAFNDGNINDILIKTPEMARAYPELKVYQNALDKTSLSHDDLLEYFVGSANTEPLLRGIGTVRGTKGIVLSEMKTTTKLTRAIRGELRAFTSGLNDPLLERRIEEVVGEARKAGDRTVLDRMLPSMADNLIDTETGVTFADAAHELSRVNQSHPAAYDIGHALGDLPVVGKGLARVGGVLTAITTQVPTQKAIQLIGEDSVEDVKALSELGRYMGMPSWARRAWADAILSADDVGARSLAVHGWLDNAMTMSGARSTKAGNAIVDRFLENARMTYGFDDSKIMDGVPRKLGIFLDEQASAINMPDLRELHRATVVGLKAQFLGIVDAPVIEASTNKIWKPAVLLRIGFIPRAGGEEYLNFLFRGGFGGMVQEFGARSVGHREAYLEAVEKAKQGLPHATEAFHDAARTISPDEAKMLSVGWTSALPAHIRPVVRIFADNNWEEPGFKWVQTYGDWVNRALKEGLGQDERIQRGLTGLAGQEYKIGSGVEGAVARSWQTPRLNLADKTNSIIFGNPHSWRRMIAGGVDDELVDAARAMYSNWDSHIAADLFTSGHAGPWDPGYDTSSQQREMVVNGERREIPTITLKGQPSIYDSTRWEYKMGVQSRAQTVVHDPLGAEIARQHVARIRGGVDIDDAQIDRLYDLADQVQSDIGRQIMHSYLGAPQEFETRAMMREVSGLDPDVRQVFDYARGTGDITPSDLMELVARKDTPAMNALHGELGTVAEIDDLLGKLDVNARGFAGQMLRGDDTIKDGWRAHRADPENVTSPFVNSWADIDDAARESAYTSALDSYNLAAVSRSERMAGANVAKEGQTVLWRLPYKTTGKTAEELVQMGVPQDLVARNMDILDELSVPAWAEDMPLTSDRELADALWAVAEPGGKPDGVRFGESVLDGRPHDDGALMPMVKRDAEDRTVLWAGHRSVYNDHRVPADTIRTAEDRAREHADQVVGQMRQALTRSNAQALRARAYDVTDEAGNVTRETGMFREHIGQRVPVDEGEALSPHRQYTNSRGRPVQYNDPARVDIGTPQFNDAGEVMWPLVGPILEDSADARQGVRRFLPKTEVKLQEGALVPAEGDQVPIFRSRSEHVLNVGAGLPATVSGPTIVAKASSRWEEFVQFGFNKVLGPAIDAIARKPQAFHFFAERYAASRKASQYLVDDELVRGVQNIFAKAGRDASDTVQMDQVAEAVRRVRIADGDAKAAGETTNQTMAWLRGNSDDELSKMLSRTIDRESLSVAPEARQAVKDAHLLRAVDPATLRYTLPEMSHQEFMSYVRSQLPTRGLESAEQLASRPVQEAIAKNPVLSRLTEGDWNTVMAAEQNFQAIHTAAGQYAAQAAINDVLPFIDSHEFKSQFADFGKQFMPFWYAEENFLKRWGRTLANEGVPTIRRAQLGYMGLKQSGVVRTDESGKDWFVYPGSGLLIDTVSKLLPVAALPLGAMMQTPTSSLLPGMNERFGAPSFSPLVTMPLGIVEAFAPELEPVQRAIVGNYAASRSVIQQIVPTQLQRFWEAATANTDSSAAFASAQTAAIAQLDAADGIPDDLSEGQRDEVLRKVRSHARVILVANALMGFVAPGTPSTIITGDTENFTGLGVKNPKDILANTYYTLIQNLGVEQGTIEYLKRYPNAGLEDIVNPLAYTVGVSKSASGAPLPATKEAGAFIAEHGAYLDEFPDGAPWLIPQDSSGKGTFSQYAYDQQTIHGLRDKQKPEDFMRSLKFKEGAGPYFEARGQYLDAVSQAELADNQDAVKAADDAWSVWSTTWKVAHPVFAEELESGDGRQRRARVIEQMRTITNDPGAPRSPQYDQLKTVMRSFDNYRLQLLVLSDDRSAVGRAATEQLKAGFSDWMTGYAQNHYEVSTFINAVLRPESSLD